MKISRWEKKYESYTNGEMNDKLRLFKIKEESKTLQKEEYKEYKRMSKIQENLPKVKNVLEFKKQLEEMRNEIIGELSRRNEISKIEEESVKLEEEFNKIIEEKQKITDQLKNKDLSKEDKEKLEKQLAECEDKYQNNNKKYLENNKKQQEAKSTETNSLTKLSKEELTDRAVKIAMKMSVCDLYGSRLMKGNESLDKIQAAEKDINWDDRTEDYKKQIDEDVKKYKLPKEQMAKMEKLKEVAKEQPNKEISKPINKEDETKVQATANDEQEKSNKEMIEVSEFDQKHPRLAKIKNWFKGIANKITRKEEIPEEKDELEESKMAEGKTEKSEQSKSTQFRASMKFIEEVNISDIAEKGIDGVREDRKRDAMKTLLNNKKNARGDDGGTIAKLEEKLKDDDARQ